MKRILFYLLVIASSGCGGGADDPPSNNHGFGWEFDAQGVSGLKLRYTPYLASGNIFSTPSHYETKFAELSACSGINAPMVPFLILIDAHGGVLGRRADGSAILGLAFTDPPLLVVDFRLAFLDNPDIVKHEMLHYMLAVTTGDPDAGHSSPLFGICAHV